MNKEFNLHTPPPFYKTTLFLGLTTLTSRILGLIRDMVIAVLFGASIQADVFFLIFRPFDLLRKLLADGIMSISFVPVLVMHLQKGETKNAANILISALIWLLILGIILIPAGFIFAPILVKLAGPGIADNAKAIELGTSLIRIMLPYALCIGCSCILMAMLHSINQFYIPGAGAVIFNGVIIISAIIMEKIWGLGILSLSIGVCLGGIAQIIIQLPWVIPKLMEWKPSFNFFSPSLNKALSGWLLCVTGAAAYQINLLIASLFASCLGWGNITAMYFADRLIQFPATLIGSTFATILLPRLTSKTSPAIHTQQNKVIDSFEHHFFFICLISFSSMAGLMAIKQPLVILLFQHGAFDSKALSQTISCLTFLSLGLWAYIGNRLFTALYHGIGMIHLPFYASMMSFGINLVLNSLLLKPMGIKGLALSVSISSVAGFAILFFSKSNPLKVYGKQLFLSACRAILIAVIMGSGVYAMAHYLMTSISINNGSLGLGLAGCILAGIVLTASATFCFARKNFLFLLQQRGKNNHHDHT